MLAIRLDPEIEKRLEALAKKTGRTKTFYAREAILEQWRRAVVTDSAVPQAAELSPPALRDHVPNILDAIIAALDDELGGAHEAVKGRELAEEKMPRERSGPRPP